MSGTEHGDLVPWRESPKVCPGLPCAVCGDMCLMWFYTNDEVWKRVSGSRGGYWCLYCFVVRAEQMGVDPHFRAIGLRTPMRDFKTTLKEPCFHNTWTTDIPMKPDFEVRYPLLPEPEFVSWWEYFGSTDEKCSVCNDPLIIGFLVHGNGVYEEVVGGSDARCCISCFNTNVALKGFVPYFPHVEIVGPKKRLSVFLHEFPFIGET